jgi:hypothetical protein
MMIKRNFSHIQLLDGRKNQNRSEHSLENTALLNY